MDPLIRIERKITFIRFVEQSPASTGFIAAATLNSIGGATSSQQNIELECPPPSFFLPVRFSHGLIFSMVGFIITAYISAGLAFIPLVAILLWMRTPPRRQAFVVK